MNIKNIWNSPVLIFAYFGLSSCNFDLSMENNVKDFELKPPIAKKVPFKISSNGNSRIDDYYWMKLSDKQKNSKHPDEQTKNVLKYLREENSYTQIVLADTNSLRELLLNEIVGRISQTDTSVPYKYNGFYYYHRNEKGSEYPLYCRKKSNLNEKEHILLDIPKMAKGHNYFDLSSHFISPDNKKLAFGIDNLSRRIYTIYFKNLVTGELLKDELLNTTGNLVWANDNKTVYYVKKDKNLRSFKVYKHVLGEPSTQDAEVFHEKDETFSCYVYKSKSNKYIIIGSQSTLTTEYRFLDADYPDGSFHVAHPRERGLEYYISHYKNHFYIKTNHEAPNFKLVRTSVTNTAKGNWKDVIPHRNETLIEDIELFKDYLVVQERREGLVQIRIMSVNSGKEYYLGFPDEAHSASIGINPDMNSEVLRINYSSLTIPKSTYDYNLASREKTVLKQELIVGGHNPNDYSSERIFATTNKGVKIPISLVYKKSLFDKNGKNPLLLYGYGSYGYSIDPNFQSERLSLLNRGFVFAIAHVRGGEEMGRSWYEDGKLLKKKNTFTDFITCAKHLLNEKYSNKENLFAMGGSAGGLLMGAIINMEPSLWKGVVAQVPFVDVLTTMLDKNIPLTTGEYDEWGNPNTNEFYDYILSYSPYDNVSKKEYPNLLITTGFYDSQVQYWEPAKWTAKLRVNNLSKNKILLFTNLEAGHGGASGRFEKYKEISMQYAFLIKMANNINSITNS